MKVLSAFFINAPAIETDGVNGDLVAEEYMELSVAVDVVYGHGVAAVGSRVWKVFHGYHEDE